MKEICSENTRELPRAKIVQNNIENSMYILLDAK